MRKEKKGRGGRELCTFKIEMSVLANEARLKEILSEMGCKAVINEFESLKSAVGEEEPDGIPLFYANDTTLLGAINQLASEHSASKVLNDYPTDEDIEALQQAYAEIAKGRNSFPSLYSSQSTKQLRYTDFLQLRDRWPEHLQPFLTVKLFVQLSDANSMSSCPFPRLVTYLQDLSETAIHYTEVMKLDPTKSGLIPEEKFVEYIKRFIPRLGFMKDKNDAYRKRYETFVIGSFLTRADPLKSHKVSVSNLLNGPLFMHWVLLRHWDEERPNPVGEQVATSVMEDFDRMDSDGDGFIDAQELMEIRNAVLTRVFTDRIIEVMCNGGKMDFEHFVRFRIAWDSLGDAWSNAIFWDILDIDSDDLLTRYEVNYFYRELTKNFLERFPDKTPPPTDWIMSEKFDMCGASEHGLTKENFVKTKAAANFVLSIVDLRYFVKMELGIYIDLTP